MVRVAVDGVLLGGGCGIEQMVRTGVEMRWQVVGWEVVWLVEVVKSIEQTRERNHMLQLRRSRFEMALNSLVHSLTGSQMPRTCPQDRCLSFL